VPEISKERYVSFTTPKYSVTRCYTDEYAYWQGMMFSLQRMIYFKKVKL